MCLNTSYFQIKYTKYIQIQQQVSITAVYAKIETVSLTITLGELNL